MLTYLSLASGAQKARIDPRTVSRTMHGQMCGVHVSGLPFIDGGAADPSLVVSWLVFRYEPADRQKIYAAWRGIGAVDVLVSIPDAYGAGWSANQFADWCAELVAAGFLPCVMGCSKDFDPADVTTIFARVMSVLPLLIARGVIARFCIGWELSLWLSPTQVQQLIDALAPICVAADVRCYVHFQQGYGSFQQPDTPTQKYFFKDFWNPNVGKLTGVLHQKVLTQNADQYRFDSGGLYDILIRFAGWAGCSPDSGFGHPFDLIALEITALDQFNGTTTEADGDALGTWAIETPSVNGPLGLVSVMGSGNGQL